MCGIIDKSESHLCLHLKKLKRWFQIQRSHVLMDICMNLNGNIIQISDKQEVTMTLQAVNLMDKCLPTFVKEGPNVCFHVMQMWAVCQREN